MLLLTSVTVAILAQGTHWAVAISQAFFYIHTLIKRNENPSIATEARARSGLATELFAGGHTVSNAPDLF